MITDGTCAPVSGASLHTMTTTVPVCLLLMFLNAAVGMRRLSSSAVLINEVTNQGSETDLCAGEDWVELVNVVGAPSSVAGMALDDSSSSPDLGIVSDLPAEVAAGKALVLGQGSCPAEIPAHGYLVVCKGEKAFTFDAAGAGVASYLEGCGFGFGNGNSDDVVLFSSAEGNVTADMIVDRTGVWNDALGNNPTAAQSLGRNGAGEFAVFNLRTLGAPNAPATWIRHTPMSMHMHTSCTRPRPRPRTMHAYARACAHSRAARAAQLGRADQRGDQPGK